MDRPLLLLLCVAARTVVCKRLYLITSLSFCNYLCNDTSATNNSFGGCCNAVNECTTWAPALHASVAPALIFLLVFLGLVILIEHKVAEVLLLAKRGK